MERIPTTASLPCSFSWSFKFQMAGGGEQNQEWRGKCPIQPSTILLLHSISIFLSESKGGKEVEEKAHISSDKGSSQYMISDARGLGHFLLTFVMSHAFIFTSTRIERGRKSKFYPLILLYVYSSLTLIHPKLIKDCCELRGCYYRLECFE